MADYSQMCSFVMMRINAFLDNELDDEVADQMRVHLSQCEECLNEIEIWTMIRSAVKHAYEPEPAPPALIDKVTERIRRLEQESV
ncbi:MAG: zf-HC2 domain-containing protein [Propionibacteriaceae bacterium]|jgi:anti-sigma factor (TIGR02949 family)|nr:zf-HC2 domain-containing protein [Propionibacteriaceae bacterium]